MPERTWEAIGKPTMIPSLGGIGLFRGKLVSLCGRLAQISMTINGTSTKEDFEIIKCIENNTPFTMLLGKPWIERDQARWKEEKEASEQKKQELKDFMTRRIAQLIKEQENGSKLFDPRDSDVEAARPLEYPQKTKVLTPEAEEMLTLKDSQQCIVTISKEDKNQNGKKNTETKLTRKKATKLSRKRAKIEKLQKVPEGASQKENL
jgi:hypothetical protein